MGDRCASTGWNKRDANERERARTEPGGAKLTSLDELRWDTCWNGRSVSYELRLERLSQESSSGRVERGGRSPKNPGASRAGFSCPPEQSVRVRPARLCPCPRPLWPEPARLTRAPHRLDLLRPSPPRSNQPKAYLPVPTRASRLSARRVSPARLSIAAQAIRVESASPVFATNACARMSNARWYSSSASL